MMLHHQAATRYTQGPSAVPASAVVSVAASNGHQSRYHHSVPGTQQVQLSSSAPSPPSPLTSYIALSSDSANNNHLKSSPNVSQVNGGTSNGKTINSEKSAAASKHNSPVTFGELIILGYNGCLPQGEKGRRRSKYQLVRRLTPNGIKKSKHYSVKQPQTSKAIQDKEQHSISFTLSRSQAIIVEYQHDDETDMFQIGRSSESPIDFVVIDTMMLDPNKPSSSHHSSQSHISNHSSQSAPQYNPLNGATQHLPSSISSLSDPLANAHHQMISPKVVQQSTISRFACRILVDRAPPYCARIYAAGFDSSKNIFLGEKATKWQTNGEIDGLTTNGILIMHPKKHFVGKQFTEDLHNDDDQDTSVEGFLNGSSGGGPPGGGVWREVSVCGEIYSVRETRSAPLKGVKIETETNVLQDGTLIDLCGATLMWRSAEGLARSPTKRLLEEMIDQLNASRPQCPVGLNTLVIPRKSASLGAADDKQPYVYLNCGHVQGYHDWGQSKHSNARTCPMCFKQGPIVKLTMGIEPSFCTSTAVPNFCFNPCGHMASDATVKYWAQVLIPHGTNGFHAMCPFCATPLQGDLGYVKLIFQ